MLNTVIKRNGTAAGVIRFKRVTGHQLSSYGSRAKRIFDNLVSEGIDELKAWKQAGDIAFDGYAPLTDSGNCHLVSTVNGDYISKPGNDHMPKLATNGKSKAKRKPASSVLRAVKLPTGNKFEAIIARGIARFAEKKQMTIPAIAKKYGIEFRTLYRLLDGDKPQTAGANAQPICDKLGITLQDLLTLGTDQP